MSARSATEPERGLTHHALEGMVWLVSGTGAQAVLRVGIVAVLARLVTPYEFGIFTAGLVVVGFTEKGAWLGLHSALIQLRELKPEHVRTGFTLMVTAGLVLGALVWIFSPALAAFFRMEDLTPVLRGMALVFPLDAVSLVSSRLLMRDLQFRRLAGIDLIAYAVGFGAVAIVLAWRGWGMWALVAGLVVQNAVQSAILFAVQPHPVRPQVDRAALRDLLYFGGGVSLAGLMNYLARNGDNAVVGRWLGPVALSLYSRAYALLNVSNNLLGGVLNQVLFPSIAKVQGEPERMAHALLRSSGLMALLFLPAGFVTIVLAPEIVDVLLGDPWAAVVVPLQILALGMVFRTGHKIGANVARGTGAVYEHAWRQGVYALAIVGGALVGQRWGIAGVAASTLFALTLNYLLIAELSLRITGVSWGRYLKVHWRAVPCTVLTTLVAWGVVGALRSMELPSAVTLAVAMMTIPATVLALALVAPRIVLGPDGRWLARWILEYRPLPIPFGQRLGQRLAGRRS